MLPVSRRGWTGRIARLAAALVLAGGVLGLAGAGTAQAAACGPVSAPPLSPAGGNLNNTGESIALFKPDPPQLPPHPDAGFVPYVLVEEINYSALSPWPVTAMRSACGMARASNRPRS